MPHSVRNIRRSLQIAACILFGFTCFTQVGCGINANNANSKPLFPWSVADKSATPAPSAAGLASAAIKRTSQNVWNPPPNPYAPQGGWPGAGAPNPAAALAGPNPAGVGGLPNGLTGGIPNTAVPGGWSNYGPTAGNNPISRLAELMNRQNEQTMLSEQQRMALAELTEYQQMQREQLAQMAQSKQQEEMDRIARQSELLAKQQAELESLSELRRRALELDANNRELHSQLAQTEQKNRIFEDQTNLLQQQLQDTASQLSNSLQAQQEVDSRFMQVQTDAEQQIQAARAQAQQQIQMAQAEAQQRVSALESTMQRRGGATIRANSSVARSLQAVTIAGLQVRQDGDVIRIELPADQVFVPGTANLNSGAIAMVDRVAGAIRQHYPRQVVGIEAHTDNRPMQGGAWNSQHQLSAAQATAVFEQLTQRHQFGARQLFVLGHGANYPVASNGTPAGQQRNRRVEVVVYPESVDAR